MKAKIGRVFIFVNKNSHTDIHLYFMLSIGSYLCHSFIYSLLIHPFISRTNPKQVFGQFRSDFIYVLVLICSKLGFCLLVGNKSKCHLFKFSTRKNY
jgi:hypothetical protein